MNLGHLLQQGDALVQIVGLFDQNLQALDQAIEVLRLLIGSRKSFGRGRVTRIDPKNLFVHELGRFGIFELLRCDLGNLQHGLSLGLWLDLSVHLRLEQINDLCPSAFFLMVLYQGGHR